MQFVINAPFCQKSRGTTLWSTLTCPSATEIGLCMICINENNYVGKYKIMNC